jgi:hypothetical protein
MAALFLAEPKRAVYTGEQPYTDRFECPRDGRRGRARTRQRARVPALDSALTTIPMPACRRIQPSYLPNPLPPSQPQHQHLPNPCSSSLYSRILVKVLCRRSNEDDFLRQEDEAFRLRQVDSDGGRRVGGDP